MFYHNTGHKQRLGLEVLVKRLKDDNLYFVVYCHCGFSFTALKLEYLNCTSSVRKCCCVLVKQKGNTCDKF